MSNESFIFYASFAEAIKSVPMEHRLQCYEALTDYALTGKYDDTDVFVRIIMAQAVPQIDANFKRREDGAKGGRPKKNTAGNNNKKPMVIENAETKKPMVIENSETKKPNVNVNDNVECINDNDNVNKEKDNTSIIPKEKKPQTPKFNFRSALLELGVPPEYVDEWLLIRKSKKAVNTEMALKVLTDEANKAGIMVAEAVKMCCENQWRGFKAEYYANLIRSMVKREDTGGGGRLRSTEEMAQIIQAGRKLYEQSLNYK